MVRRRTDGPILGVVAALCCVPLAARAQDSSPATIIVTGERIDRTVAETDSSVHVTTRDELDRSPDIDRFDQLLENTPNVTLGSGGLGPTIRGQDTTGVLRDLPASWKATGCALPWSSTGGRCRPTNLFSAPSLCGM